MSAASVLLVGLPQAFATGVNDGATTTQVQGVAEAIDSLLLSPPSLVVANHRIGDLDSLDFFRQILAADPLGSTPIMFVGTRDEDGIQPFVYQRSAEKREIRYLDRDGQLQSHFALDAGQQSPYSVRAVKSEHVMDAINGFLLNGELPSVELTQEEQAERLWEMGFNQNLSVGHDDYHIQTEVTEIAPLTVDTSVYAGGRAVHSAEHRIKVDLSNLNVVREAIERVHTSVVRRVDAGEIR